MSAHLITLTGKCSLSICSQKFWLRTILEPFQSHICTHLIWLGSFSGFGQQLLLRSPPPHAVHLLPARCVHVRLVGTILALWTLRWVRACLPHINQVHRVQVAGHAEQGGRLPDIARIDHSTSAAFDFNYLLPHVECFEPEGNELRTQGTDPEGEGHPQSRNGQGEPGCYHGKWVSPCHTWNPSREETCWIQWRNRHEFWWGSPPRKEEGFSMN